MKYHQMVERHRLSGLGQDFFSFESAAPDSGYDVAPAASTNIFSQVIEGAKSIVPALFAAKSQQDLNEINLERARRGMSPLSPAYLQSTAPRVNVGMAPEIQTMVMYGGLALLAVLLIPRLLPRR